MHLSHTPSILRVRARRLTAVVAAILLASFASSVAADAPALDRPRDAPRQAETAPKRGLLYEIGGGAATIYLFGTLHVGKPEFYPLGRETNRALTEAKKLYLEVNLTDPTVAKTVRDVATYPEGESLERTLPPSLMKKVDVALERYKLPRAS